MGEKTVMDMERVVLKSLLIVVITLILIACVSDSASIIPQPSTGVGGSTARFTISGDQLFTVDNESLNVFDISNSSSPVKTNDILIGFGIETIFPKDSLLFIGSQFGMVVYDISGNFPVYLANFQHAFSCDPVVADDKYAYITLRGGNNCGRFGSQLDIVEITNILAPRLVISYPMTEPFGLAIDNELLFVCDEGLKVYNASDVTNLELLNHFNINAKDVIPYQGILMVIGDQGLYQYNYFGNEIELLSLIAVSR